MLSNLIFACKYQYFTVAGIIREPFPYRLFMMLAVISLLLHGCDNKAETSARTEAVKYDLKLVKTEIIRAMPARGSIEYVGTLLAYQKVNVASELGGTIEKLYFEKGEKIKKGYLLAEIGTTTLTLEVRRARAARKEAEAAVFEAMRNYKRIKNLHGIHAVAESEFDNAKRSADMAGANMERTAAALALAEDRQKKSRLHAPIDGIIAFRDVEEREVISHGTTVTQIVNLEKLKIKVSIGEKDIHILNKLKSFDFTVDAIPDRNFSCRVFFISPVANPTTRSFPVEMLVAEPDPLMADGMTAKVTLPLLSEKKTIKVPSSWLSEENGKIGLYVVDVNQARFVEVVLGAYYDQRVEIVSGVNDQQRIIVNPSGLRSGDRIKY